MLIVTVVMTWMVMVTVVMPDDNRGGRDDD